MKFEKKKLRENIKEQIKHLSPDYLKKSDELIARHVISLPEYQQAQTIFSYVSKDSEVNTIPILQDALKKGKTVTVPKCIDKGVVEAFQITSLSALRLGKYGILEPGENCPKIEAKAIDLCIVPCLSCSTDGKRLGYGGGYYDRYLKKGEFTKIALCRSKLVSEDIPVDEHDVKMDKVVTD